VALVFPLLVTSCGGTLSSRTAREQIVTLGGDAVSPEDVQVARISAQAGDRAIAEFTVQLAGEYARNADGEWNLVSVRIGEEDWILLDDLEAALRALRVSETTSNVTMLATGVEAYARANGVLPPASGPDPLPVVLHPLFVPRLVRRDSWGSEFLYQPSGGTFSVLSAGPDRMPGTGDDIEVTGEAAPTAP
jgi:hypothetical protein